MDREQFKRLIEMAEYSPRLPGLNNYFLDASALAAAKEDLAKWLDDYEIDETPRIRPENAERFTSS